MLESTLELYYRTAKEEEGVDGPMAVKVREIKKSIREYRRKSDAAEKKETPTRRSHYLFYDSVDEDVDESGPYDAPPPWDIESGLKNDAVLRDLVEQHKYATDEEEVKRLEKIIIDSMMKNMLQETKDEKEPTIDDDLEDDLEDDEIKKDEDSEDDWEDSDDDIEYIGIWERADAEAFELYDQAESRVSPKYHVRLVC